MVLRNGKNVPAAAVAILLTALNKQLIMVTLLQAELILMMAMLQAFTEAAKKISG